PPRPTRGSRLRARRRALGRHPPGLPAPAAGLAGGPGRLTSPTAPLPCRVHLPVAPDRVRDGTAHRSPASTMTTRFAARSRADDTDKGISCERLLSPPARRRCSCSPAAAATTPRAMAAVAATATGVPV